MTYTALLALLTQEHWSRYGCAPTHRAWLWEPWVGDFLRWYDPPRPPVQEVRHAS